MAATALEAVTAAVTAVGSRGAMIAISAVGHVVLHHLVAMGGSILDGIRRYNSMAAGKGCQPQQEYQKENQPSTTVLICHGALSRVVGLKPEGAVPGLNEREVILAERWRVAKLPAMTALFIQIAMTGVVQESSWHPAASVFCDLSRHARTLPAKGWQG